MLTHSTEAHIVFNSPLEGVEVCDKECSVAINPVSLPSIFYVTVTTDDIENGVRGTATGCPVALAIARTLDRADVFAIVNPTRVALCGYYSQKEFTPFTPSTELREFIVRYDNHEPVSAETFQLTREFYSGSQFAR